MGSPSLSLLPACVLLLGVARWGPVEAQPCTASVTRGITSGVSTLSECAATSPVCLVASGETSGDMRLAAGVLGVGGSESLLHESACHASCIQGSGLAAMFYKPCDQFCAPYEERTSDPFLMAKTATTAITEPPNSGTKMELFVPLTGPLPSLIM